MSKGNIIDKMYYGEISPYKTAAFQEKSKQADALYEQVRGFLNEQEQQTFDEFISKNMELEVCLEREKFKEGFILGVRMMVETLGITK